MLNAQQGFSDMECFFALRWRSYASFRTWCRGMKWSALTCTRTCCEIQYLRRRRYPWCLRYRVRVVPRTMAIDFLPLLCDSRNYFGLNDNQCCTVVMVSPKWWAIAAYFPWHNFAFTSLAKTMSYIVLYIPPIRSTSSLEWTSINMLKGR